MLLPQFLLALLVFTCVRGVLAANCRNVPGTPGYPTEAQWASLNSTVSGRLVAVVPSAKFCTFLPSGSCKDAQWSSAVFRNEIPGAMNQVNFESDWDSTPPSLCLRNATTCGQGNTPLFAVLAETTVDIQAGVKFAQSNNLRIAIKASGHDLLGRSTAQSSILISTHKLKNITFTDNFFIGKKSKGSAITVGSGVTLSEMYTASGAVGKIFVGGTASTVVAAGGYVQGAGHSSLSPLLGLAADNCLELHVVLANGMLVVVNEEKNNDLFWAMRGGGAGSWGVIISATFKTFPTFNVAVSSMSITTANFDTMSKVIAAHARHIFKWDPLNASQYLILTSSGNLTVNGRTSSSPSIYAITYFPKASLTLATTALEPFIDEARLLGANVTNSVVVDNINRVLTVSDDTAGTNTVMGSRLVDASVYRKDPTMVGKTYIDLLKTGPLSIVGVFVAGGQVSRNVNVSSAVNPKWRTAKAHLIIVNGWDDSTPIPAVRETEGAFRDKQLPILQRLAPSGAGAYSNEADAMEADFQRTFYGPNYPRLSAIKAKYDPHDLFIVRAGVGSERWDEFGLCGA